ncbi:beta-phosphoglucomutase, partial [Desulfobacteraceae bacterium SEEP-SAG9]
ADPHLCALKFDFTPINYSDTVHIRSAIDGTVINDNVARYRQLNSKHLAPVSQGQTKNGIYLHVQTNRSRYQIAMHAITAMYESEKSIRPLKTIVQKKGYIAEILTLDARENKTYSLE